ncbi:MAG TPA: hypothetical protein VF791_16670 [Pyrinomonadaceae bacterium]
MLDSSPVPKTHTTRRRRNSAAALVLMAHCGLLGCTSSVQPNNAAQNSVVKADGPVVSVRNEEGTPVIKYDERGRIKGLFGLRTDPSADPTCKLEEFTVDFVNIERNEYLLFSLPSTFHVWVKVEGEMQQIFSDPKNTKAREFLAKGKKYRLRAYSCDAIGHTTYETVSVELLN